MTIRRRRSDEVFARVRLSGVAFILALFPALSARAEAVYPVRSFVGYAHDLKSGSLLYEEHHLEELRDDGGSELRTRYLGPTGRVIAVREVDFTGDPVAPGFRLDDTRAGYSEGMVPSSDRIVVFRQTGLNENPERRELPRSGSLVVDAGFDRLVTGNWGDLVSGRSVAADFLVPSRLRTLRFIVEKEGEQMLEGEPVIIFRLIPANRLLRLLVDPIRVSYHSREKFLMRYEGISNVKSSNGRPLTVRIDFPIDERSEVDRALHGGGEHASR